MDTTTENVGSTARDFCMLERNVLAHLKLGEPLNRVFLQVFLFFFV